MAFRLEYSQRYNGKHRAWIEIDTFPTFQAALDASGQENGYCAGPGIWVLASERDRIVNTESEV